MAQTLDQTMGETVGQKTDQTPQVVVERPTREGSPWTGLWAVVGKDMADHLTSVRMLILMLLIVLTAVGTVWGALQEIRSAAPDDPFLFLRLFTTAHDPLPAVRREPGVVDAGAETARVPRQLVRPRGQRAPQRVGRAAAGEPWRNGAACRLQAAFEQLLLKVQAQPSARPGRIAGRPRRRRSRS